MSHGSPLAAPDTGPALGTTFPLVPPAPGASPSVVEALPQPSRTPCPTTSAQNWIVRKRPLSLPADWQRVGSAASERKSGNERTARRPGGMREALPPAPPLGVKEPEVERFCCVTAVSSLLRYGFDVTTAAGGAAAGAVAGAAVSVEVTG